MGWGGRHLAGADQREVGAKPPATPSPHSTNCIDAKTMCSLKGVRAAGGDRRVLEGILQQETCNASHEKGLQNLGLGMVTLKGLSRKEH